MKKKIAFALCIVLLFGLISGCSDKSTDANGQKQGISGDSSKQVTIHLFHQKQEAQEAFTQIIKAFNETYPNITVEQEIVTNEPAAILKARLATGEAPDIFQGSTDTIDIARGGYIMDISGESFLDNVTDEARWDSTFSDDEGHNWALPIDGSCEGIFYNKDIFNTYNLQVPKTLSEFKKVVSTLKENGVTPFALGFKDSWTIKPVSLVAAASAVYGREKDWDEQKNSGNASFASTDGWTTTFELLKFVYENGNTSTAFDTDYNGACAMVANGECAMMIQGLWALEPIKEINPDANLGMMAMPVSENESETKLFQFPDFGLSISASTEYPEECKLFLEFLTHPEIAELWCSTSKLFSAVKGVSVDFDPLAKDVEAYIDAGAVCTQVDRGWPTAFGPEYETALSNYLMGTESLDSIMSELDSAWEMARSAGNQ